MATQGSVASLWRYPVKSMLGEESGAIEVTERGLLGDRAYALVDSADGKAATAKNPRKRPTLVGFRANFIEPPCPGTWVPPVRITLPDGTTVTRQQPDLDQVLSRALGRTVTLTAAGPGNGRTVGAEEYWPDMEGLEQRDTVTDFPLPEGTFFDCAMVHLLTTATLDRLHQLYPPGRFEVPRFRPNIVIAPASGETDFVENAWVGHTVAIGDSVRLSSTGPCVRRVMTTLAQGTCHGTRASCVPRPSTTRSASACTRPWGVAVRSATGIRSGASERLGRKQSPTRFPRRTEGTDEYLALRRAGRRLAIATVVDDFIDQVMDDPRLNANPKVDEAHHRVSRAGFKLGRAWSLGKGRRASRRAPP
jgi:uncharacterized protein YcbX